MEWIERKDIPKSVDIATANLRWKYECSECGYEVRSKYNFCPSCRKALNCKPITKIKEKEMEWIETSDQLPPRGEWVLVDREDWQKPCEVMCYQGIRIGHHTIHHVDGTITDEDYEYPSWTSGHGDIRPSHPIRWMPLPETETMRKLKEGKLWD